MKNRLLTKLIATVGAVIIGAGALTASATYVYQDAKENVWVAGYLRQNGDYSSYGTTSAINGTHIGNRLYLRVNLYYMKGLNEYATYGPEKTLNNSRQLSFTKYSASDTYATRSYGTHINYVHWNTSNQDSATVNTAVYWK